ncbi:hypothetical protein JVT61DRAFT_14227 [Boletus reticuloceps]|uniref:DUF6534 domain-containing protein n=1 Tax=Boletus reticuloceps TaxID=495285 RepID=A0A8I3A369_9AGAM|nr:hypothetical protein JVT61DRAFT_1442 [Boletus reticuloceps]KAG6369606.1 hypothetical protein JVT61DRAFT_14227 [Boletus reticuloceps]
MPIPPSLTPLFFFFPSPPFPPPHVAYRPSDHIPLPGLYAPHSSVFTGRLTRVRLYGLTLAQTWYYFHSFPKDSCRTKILVAFLSALGTAQIVLVSASIYQYTIVYAGDIDMSGYVTSYATFLGLSITDLSCDSTQVRSLWRYACVHTYRSYPAILAETYVAACTFSPIVYLNLTYSTVNPQWQNTRGSNLSAMIFYFSSITCDLLIAGSQAYLFHKSRTGIGRLGGLISKLTILVINVGLLTRYSFSPSRWDILATNFLFSNSADVTVFLVLFLACPSNGAFLVPYILMSHCEFLSFSKHILILARSLNSRLFLRELVDKEEYTCPNIVVSSGRFRAQSNIVSALTMSIPVSLANTIPMPRRAVPVPVLDPIPFPVRVAAAVTTARAVSI